MTWTAFLFHGAKLLFSVIESFLFSMGSTVQLMSKENDLGFIQDTYKLGDVI